MAPRARCASTSAPRRASARRSPCSTRAAGAASAAPTSSSASSRPTAARTTAEQIGDLEVVPRRDGRLPRHDVRGDGRRRRPRAAGRRSRWSTSSPTPTCPGSRNEKRWQDVEELLDAGIDVISTVNIQHLESLNDVVERITGITQRETSPTRSCARADQIELVDMSPEALRRRMAHGNIYRPRRIDAALGNYFRAGNLAALRELALLWVADRVDEALAGLPRAARHRPAVGDARAGRRRPHRRARTATPHPARRAHGRSAPKGDLIGVHVRAAGRARRPASADAARPSSARCSRSSAATYHEVVGSDVAAGARSTSPAARTPPRSCSAPARRSRWQRARHAARSSTASSAPPGRHRRPRDLPTRDAAREARAAPAPPVRPRCPRAASSPGWVARGRRPPAAHAVALAPPARHLGLPSVLLLYLLAGRRRRRGRRRLAGGRRAAVAGSCSPTGSSRRRSTRSRSPRARTCSRSPSSCSSRAIVSGFVVARGAARRRGQRARAPRPRPSRRLAGTPRPSPTSSSRLRRRRSGSTASLSAHRDGGRAGSSSAPPAAPRRRAPTDAIGRRRVDGGARARARRAARRADDDSRVLDAFAAQLAALARASSGSQAEARTAATSRAANDLRTALLLGGLARPAHAAGRDQGVGHEPAPRRRRLDAGRATPSSSRRSTRRPTGSTRSSATCST